MKPFYSLGEIPAEIRETMARLWAAWDTRDLALDATLALVHPVHATAQQLGTMSRATANRDRVPTFCEQVREIHALSRRATWRVVGLYLGLHPSHVQRLCYRARR